MERSIEGCTLALVQGDVTREATEAIVNAANGTLLGGGGVDGAIHAAAGPGLVAECRTLGGCETGDAKLTRGYNLKAHYVIHAVGPVYRDGKHCEPDLLASAYRRCLQLAVEHGIQSIAFPAISTGIYGYPMNDAAEIALGTVAAFLRQHHAPSLVRMVLYSPEAYAAYAQALERLRI